MTSTELVATLDGMTKSVARLYEQFQPSNYALTLRLDRDAMTFRGSVTVRGRKTGKPSQRLTFHQKGLKITAATIIKHDKKSEVEVAVSRINNQDSYDEVRLHADTMLYPGEYTVSMEFSGAITRPMNGIYPCFFTHEGTEKKLIATQFESHHAREAFPCIDEPQAKATFDLTLHTPAGENEVVLANTPVKDQKTVEGLFETTFETTPVMSTYLLAFVFGELGYTEAKTNGDVTVRCYATPDNVPLTEHGLQVAVRSLDFFSDYFGIPYPLAKLDMVALPDFSSGAMENWGLVTYRETTMLADNDTSSIESKQLVALVIAHELSHQWFGNLVTMKWWDDLWLNESFANLMEYRATDALYPEWHIWEQFVSSEAASARRRDSLADVQSIKTEVNHPDEISTLFDPSIVYAKGGTVLYMLMRFIGEDAFREGLQAYFKEHRYGNTSADDLWKALSASSKQDIGSFMNGWLTRPGYPLITVDWQPGEKEVSLTQRRFLNDPLAKNTSTEPWQIPLASTVPLKPAVFASLSGKASLGSSDAPLILNHDGQSYALPYYQNTAHLKAITNAVAAGSVSTIDRLLLIDNSTMLQRGGVSATTELLSLLPAYKQESSESVWGVITLAVGEVRRLIEGDEVHEDKLNNMLQGLIKPLVEELGWDDATADSAQTLRLRGLAYSIAAAAKLPSILEAGLQRFEAFEKPSDLPASTRSVVYFIGARYGTDNDFEKLLALHHKVQNADEKDEIASSLTSVKKSTHYKRLLEMLTTDEIRRQDLMHWWVWLLRNRYSREDAWQWLTSHWEWIEKEFSSDKSYSFFARYAGSIFSHREELTKYSDFFEPKKSVVSLARDITLAEQEITGRVTWRERNESAVKTWLDDNIA